MMYRQNLRHSLLSLKYHRKGESLRLKIVQAEGGKNRRDWDYQRIYTAYAEVNVQTETAVKIDTLADGSVKYSGEWYTFYVSRISVRLKPC